MFAAARKRLIAVLAGALVALGVAAPVLADDVPVAVAANFTEPVKQIAAAFQARTGHHLVLSFGSSGQFYTQITQGAPFQVFLSADAERPQRLEREGLGVPGTRFTYAVGQLVLYSRTPGLADDGGAALRRGAFAKLAIADPATAPYGVAAIQAMTRMGVYPKLAAKIVKGSSITQAFQFVQSGAAELGFVALSQVVGQRGGSRWVVPPALHAPIEQQAILLAPGQKRPAARAFLAFLKSPEARAIIRRYGYEAR